MFTQRCCAVFCQQQLSWQNQHRAWARWALTSSLELYCDWLTGVDFHWKSRGYTKSTRKTYSSWSKAFVVCSLHKSPEVVKYRITSQRRKHVWSILATTKCKHTTFQTKNIYLKTARAVRIFILMLESVEYLIEYSTNTGSSCYYQNERNIILAL